MLHICYAKSERVNDVQFGLRKLRSTTSTVLRLNDYVLNALDDKQFVIAVFLDFKKAFDTVDHQILQKKNLNIQESGELPWTGSVAIS